MLTGGDVTVTSRLGEGSVFHVSLTLERFEGVALEVVTSARQEVLRIAGDQLSCQYWSLMMTKTAATFLR